MGVQEKWALVAILVSMTIGCRSRPESQLKQTVFSPVPAMPWTYDEVSEFQDDSRPWHCGVQSVYRALNTLGVEVGFHEVARKIGQHEFEYEVFKDVQETIESEVCDYLGPLRIVCEPLSRIVSIPKKISLPVQLGIGRAPYQLKDQITSHFGVPAYAKEKQSLDDLRSLLDRGVPVLALLQLGKDGGEIMYRGVRFGSFHFPKLHWVLVNGYDDAHIHYIDTDSNDQGSYTVDEFFKRWDWSMDGWNKRSLVHAHLTRSEGLEVRSLVYLDVTLPQIAVFRAYQRGFRRAPTQSEMDAGMSKIKERQFSGNDFLVWEIIQPALANFYQTVFGRDPTEVEIDEAIAEVVLGQTLVNIMSIQLMKQGEVAALTADLAQKERVVADKVRLVSNLLAPYTESLLKAGEFIENGGSTDDMQRVQKHIETAIFDRCPLPNELVAIDTADLAAAYIKLTDLKAKSLSFFLSINRQQDHNRLWSPSLSTINDAKLQLNRAGSKLGVKFCETAVSLFKDLTQVVAQRVSVAEATSLLDQIHRVDQQFSIYFKYLAPLVDIDRRLTSYLHVHFAPHHARDAYRKAIGSLQEVSEQVSNVDLSSDIRERYEERFRVVADRLIRLQPEVDDRLLRSDEIRQARRSIVVRRVRYSERYFSKRCLQYFYTAVTSDVTNQESEQAFMMFNDDCM